MALRPAGFFTDAPITLKQIEDAYAAIAPHLVKTPVKRSLPLSERCSCDVYLKLENLQATGSFKERGALNKLLQLTPQQREKGVIAASAGNHAQGLAYHARRLGVHSTIVMPTTTPLVKVQATEGHGAKVILDGNGYDEAFVAAQEIAMRDGLILSTRSPTPMSSRGREQSASSWRLNRLCEIRISCSFPSAAEVLLPGWRPICGSDGRR